MQELVVLNPVAKINPLRFDPAARPRDLRNLKVAMLWNSKAGGDVALRRIGEKIKTEIGAEVDIEFVQDDHPSAMSTLQRLADSCDAVIGASAD